MYIVIKEANFIRFLKNVRHKTVVEDIDNLLMSNIRVNNIILSRWQVLKLEVTEATVNLRWLNLHPRPPWGQLLTLSWARGWAPTCPPCPRWWAPWPTWPPNNSWPFNRLWLNSKPWWINHDIGLSTRFWTHALFGVFDLIYLFCDWSAENRVGPGILGSLGL